MAREFFECNNCGFFHETQAVIDCGYPLNRYKLEQIPNEDGVEILYLTKEQGGKFYVDDDKPKMNAFQVLAVVPGGAAKRMTVWTATKELALQSAKENYPSAREIWIDGVPTQ